MRQPRGLVISLVAPVVVLAACSSSSSSSSSSAFIEQYCSLLRPCCQPSSAGGQPGSGCGDFYTFFGGNVDGATGDACIAEIHAHQNDMGFCSNASSLTPSCQKAFSRMTGTNPPGAACQSSADCAPSTEGKVSCEFVTTASSSSSSICRLTIDGKVGDMPCIGTKDGSSTHDTDPMPPPGRGFLCDLAKNVWCNPMSNACEATLKLGDACTVTNIEECGTDASCGTGDKCVANPPSTSPTQPPAMDSSLFAVCSTKN